MRMFAFGWWVESNAHALTCHGEREEGSLGGLAGAIAVWQHNVRKATAGNQMFVVIQLFWPYYGGERQAF